MLVIHRRYGGEQARAQDAYNGDECARSMALPCSGGVEDARSASGAPRPPRCDVAHARRPARWFGISTVALGESETRIVRRAELAVPHAVRYLVGDAVCVLKWTRNGMEWMEMEWTNEWNGVDFQRDAAENRETSVTIRIQRAASASTPNVHALFSLKERRKNPAERSSRAGLPAVSRGKQWQSVRRGQRRQKFTLSLVSQNRNEVRPAIV